MPTLPFSATAFHEGAQSLIALTRELAARGWTPATSSNFSLRLDARHALITLSGRDKGRLTEADFMVVDARGHAVASEHRPSAETLLHVRLYQRHPEVGCVLHTHSHNQTVASRLWARAGRVRLQGYELIKAFAGQHTHEAEIELPVLPNSQDMDELAALADAAIRAEVPGYLIDGHGLYAWGPDLATARRHLEAFEFLLGVELDLRRLGATA